MSFETISFNFSVDEPSEEESSATAELVFEARVPVHVREYALWLQHLDSQVIVETQRLHPSKQHRCNKCFTENFGKVLDEALILLPFPKGPFRGRTDLLSNISVKGKVLLSMLTAPRITSEARRWHFADWYSPKNATRYGSNGQYLITQDIVRSGLFTQEQLRGATGKYSHLLSRHELEVGLRAFDLVRPETCITCRNIPLSGLSPYWGVLYDRNSDQFPLRTGVLEHRPQVDDLHAAGVRVRTGFRIRSKDSIRRRRYGSIAPKTFYRYNQTEILSLWGSNLSTTVDFKFPLKWKNTKRARRATKYRRRRFFSKEMNRKKFFPFSVPVAHHTKYWYFFRKHGRFYLSQHHPYGDERYVYHASGS